MEAMLFTMMVAQYREQDLLSHCPAEKVVSGNIPLDAQNSDPLGVVLYLINRVRPSQDLSVAPTKTKLVFS